MIASWRQMWSALTSLWLGEGWPKP